MTGTLGSLKIHSIQCNNVLLFTHVTSMIILMRNLGKSEIIVEFIARQIRLQSLQPTKYFKVNNKMKMIHHIHFFLQLNLDFVINLSLDTEGGFIIIRIRSAGILMNLKVIIIQVLCFLYWVLFFLILCTTTQFFSIIYFI